MQIKEARKFKDVYRVESTRHPDWNYAEDAMYYVTICTKDRREYFGEVIIEKMYLNNIGKIANEFWREIPQHFSNVTLDQYIIMPNHVHGVIFICNDDASPHRRGEAMPRLYVGEYPQMSKISPKPKSVPVIIGSFKSICTKTINQKYPNINFSWQSRFYDHIIRNEYSLQNIRNYIYYNPVKWEDDRNNPENLFM